MQYIKSPLRYPGGKSRAISQVSEYIPNNFSEYREPFLGGGSVFLYLRQKFPHLTFWINDLNYDVYCFWKYAQMSCKQLVSDIKKIKQERENGRELFKYFTAADVTKLSEFERAVRFFVLNRITFSGTVDSGGFSQKAFEGRFTYSSIERIALLENILAGIKITNSDYRELLKESGQEVFLFLDPPYLSTVKSRLYGKNGNLHTSFDHNEFSQELKVCSHLWLITYDDSPEIRKKFTFANLYEWQLQYGMNNYKQKHAAKGNELFIANYEAHQQEQGYIQLEMNYPADHAVRLTALTGCQ